MKSISKNDYMALVGLREIAKRYLDILDFINASAQKITNELDQDGNPEDMGHTSDYIYGSRELDDLLRLLKISVNE